MMESEFQMCMMRELTFFLRYPSEANEARYLRTSSQVTKELMKKFNMAELKPMSTSMSSADSLGPDEDGEAVD
jgi:hypothetical protein